MRGGHPVKSTVMAALALVGVLVLSGCNEKSGAAAFAADDRISVDSLNQYVATSNADKAATVRSDALQYLIRTSLFEELLRRHGGVPSDSELSELHDQVLPDALKSANLTGSAADRAFAAALAPNGFAPSFVPLYLRSQEMALELGARKVKSEELCRLRLSLNPRFGAWDWSTVGIKTDQAQSDFLVSGPPLGSTECHISG
jgi:hypothetical protein